MRETLADQLSQLEAEIEDALHEVPGALEHLNYALASHDESAAAVLRARAEQLEAQQEADKRAQDAREDESFEIAEQLAGELQPEAPAVDEMIADIFKEIYKGEKVVSQKQRRAREQPEVRRAEPVEEDDESD